MYGLLGRVPIQLRVHYPSAQRTSLALLVSGGAAPVVIDGAGHFVYFDRPQQFADEVTRFFARHLTGSAGRH